jgi:glycosyltransferase involved in cell wall biosynthesis
LAKRHRVTAITADAWRERRLARRFDWSPPGVRLKSLDVPYTNDMTTPERLRSFLSYAGKALWEGASTNGALARRPDLIYASSTPLTVGAVGAALSMRWRCPWIFEVRDLWPDFPVQMGALDGHPLLRRALYGLEHFLYRSADHVVTASPDMAAHVQRFTAARKVSSIAYGTDFDMLSKQVGASERDALRRRLHLEDDETVVLYAGSFGRANALPTLVEAARSFSGSPRRVRFVFAGAGYHRALLEQAARRLPHVSLLDPLPYPEALALFQLVDLSLVSFIDRPVLSTNAPSKFFDSLAAGTPVVVTNPGWTKDFVERHRCGWYAPAQQPGALHRRIGAAARDEQERRRAADNARRAARTHFDRAAHMNDIRSLIEDVAR